MASTPTGQANPTTCDTRGKRELRWHTSNGARPQGQRTGGTEPNLTATHARRSKPSQDFPPITAIGSTAHKADKLDSHMHQLYRAFRLIRARRIYNPPGDGLCFWYALANAKWPHHTTHYAKQRQAPHSTTDHTIEYCHPKRLLTPNKKHEVMASLLRSCGKEGEDRSETAMRQQLTYLLTHPTGIRHCH